MTQKTLENWRKQLIFRADHRGTKEMDLIMGRFAKENVPDFNEADCMIFEDLLQENDPNLYNWLTGKEEPPANLTSLPMLQRIKSQYE
jgi:antitoxin CptB